MKRVPVMVVVDSAADFAEVRAACEFRGLVEVSTLPQFGTLRGLIDETLIDEIARTPGIRSVERERQIQLPPPNSRVQ
jgi:hypothetical protein